MKTLLPRAWIARWWLLFALVPLAAEAEVYKYRDSAGRIHLTDQPMRGSYKLLKTYRFQTGSRPAVTTHGALAAMRERRRAVAPTIARVAAETELPPELLHAVVRAESAYDPKAVSRKGAVGLMQLMPATATRYGVADRENPAQNLSGGARYLRDLLEMFDQDLHLALAAYNAGENAVLRYGRQIPPYQETQTYVKRVLAFLSEHRQLAGQERLVQN
jgi:soluble lytic murein transglycosylase-like protein